MMSNNVSRDLIPGVLARYLSLGLEVKVVSNGHCHGGPTLSGRIVGDACS